MGINSLIKCLLSKQNKLKQLKQMVIIWEKDKKKAISLELSHIEDQIVGICRAQPQGIFSSTAKEHLVHLDVKKQNLLMIQVETLIHMDIGGHPPIPLAQNSFPFWQFSSNFSKFFQVQNFRAHFEALNDVFWQFKGGNGCCWHGFTTN